MGRTVNNKREQGPKMPGQQPKPKTQRPKPPEPKVAGPGRSGDIPKVTAQEQQQGQQQTAQQWSQRPLQSQNHILNAIEAAPDAAWMGYRGAQYIQQGMKAFQSTAAGKATSSVQNVWESHSAWAKIMQSAMTAAAQSPPGMGLQEAYDTMYGHGSPTSPMTASPEQESQAMVGGAVSMLLDPTIWSMALVPGGGEVGAAAKVGEVGAEEGAKVAPEVAAAAGETAGKEAAAQTPEEAAQAAPGAEQTAQTATEAPKPGEKPQEPTPEEQAAQANKVQTIVNELKKQAPTAVGQVGYNIVNDPNPTPQSLAWDIGLGVLMSGGAVPPGTRQLLKALGPQWDRLATRLSDQYVKSLTDQAEFNGNRSEFLGNLLQNEVDEGAMQPFRQTVKTAPELETGTYTKDPATGEISMQSVQKKRMKSLQQMGLESIGDLQDHLERGDLSQEQIKLLKKDWQYLGLPYNLVRVGKGEAPLVNPSTHIDQMAEPAKAGTSMNFLRMFMDHAHKGPMGNSEAPLTSLWRTMIGFNRATDFLHQNLIGSWARVLGDDATKVSVQKNLMRAAEGDQAVYDKLSPEQKFVVDSWRVAVATMRRVAKDTQYSKDFTDYYVPRMRVQTEEMKALRKSRGPSGAGASTDVLKGERKAHRSIGAQLVENDGEEPEIQLETKYQSIFDLNKDEAGWRNALVDDLLDKEKPLNEVEFGDKAQVRALRAMRDPAQARMVAEKLAYETRPDYETNFLAAANRSLGNKLSAIHGYQGAQALKDMVIKDKATGKMVQAAFDDSELKRSGMDIQRTIEQGYQRPDSPYFKGMLVHKDFADLLNRGSRAAKAGLKNQSEAFRGLLGIERTALAGIMYSPTIHGMNIAGRFGMAWTSHPLTMARYLTRGGLREAADRAGGFMNRDYFGETLDDMYNQIEAYRAGVVPFSKYTNYGSEAYTSHADALGDQAIAQYPGITDSDDVPSWVKQHLPDQVNGLSKPVKSAYDYFNNILWRNVGDFGVMMYHVEKEGILKRELARGTDPNTADDVATKLAARRANSWMGHVAPEDTNPILHDLARTMFFAPNWWRTWGELLTGVYKDAGFSWTRERLMSQVANDLRVAIAAYGFQRMTGNVFNFALSGHLQSDNQPGNQDKIEITDPWAIRAMQDLGLAGGVDPNTGENPKTGARLTIENPLARQQYAAESAAGFESGQKGTPLAKIGPVEIDGPPGWDAAWQGTTKEIGARMSPLLESIAALGNIDLYNTIASGQVRHLNPEENAPGLDDALMSLLDLTPMGYTGAQAVEQGEGVYGTNTQPSIKAALSSIGNASLREGLSQITGVNPPYATAPRSAGQQLTDQQYMQIAQLNKQYDDQMNQLQNELTSNQITPDEWRTQYEQLTVQHAVVEQAFYANAPNYTGGTDALVNSYESLYTNPQVLNADGTINEEALQQLQQQWQADHSSAQWNSVQSVLAKNQQKFPAIKAYKNAIQGYYNFQDQWAKENGVNVYQLQSESKEYGQLYGTPAGPVYLGTHPELEQWEAAKKVWMLTTSAGYTYGVYEGSSTAIKAAEAANPDAGTINTRYATKNPNAAAQLGIDEQILAQELMGAGESSTQAQEQASVLAQGGAK